ncbi:hypothetical protein H6F86_20530 [Phormidium sp. FACHB-592]|uniref:N-acetyltransferase domain-containing protein n=1 Tax=Stenomitos frigidus AS-A4 TaxID=2933935 RepID=A0ABV0KEH0_9CYAN|nr:hypothetical protein [Phormidium sp. FACHB-592]MBD2076219.1 hypothetical protein [Phormidium sp. FACHB-592]
MPTLTEMERLADRYSMPIAEVVAVMAAREDAECGRGWQGNKPGCTRAKSKASSSNTTAVKKESAPQQVERKAKTKAVEAKPKDKSIKEAENGSKVPGRVTRTGSSSGVSTGGNTEAETLQSSGIKTDADKKEVEKNLRSWISKNADLRGKKDAPKTLEDNASIAFEILDKVESGESSFTGIKDKKGNLQAAAIVKEGKDHLEIEYLATAPWNIAGKDKKAVRGAGTAAMASVIAESVNKGHGGKIRLDALPGAIPFYEKIGFSVTGKTKGGNDGVMSMELTPQAANAFLEKIGKKAKMDSLHPSTASLISAIAKYQQQGYDIAPAIDSIRSDGKWQPCGKGYAPPGTCKNGKPEAKGKTATSRHILNPNADLNSSAGQKEAVGRTSRINQLVDKLANGRFKVTPDDPNKAGKMGALTAMRDAKNPNIGLITSHNAKDGITGAMSYKEGRNTITVQNFGADGSAKGSGSEMFNQLLLHAAKQGKGLEASSVEGAKGFYSKMGMTDEGYGQFSMSKRDVAAAVAKLNARTDSRLDATTKNSPPKPCGKGWQGTKPGCTRAGKGQPTPTKSATPKAATPVAKKSKATTKPQPSDDLETLKKNYEERDARSLGGVTSKFSDVGNMMQLYADEIKSAGKGDKTLTAAFDRGERNWNPALVVETDKDQYEAIGESSNRTIAAAKGSKEGRAFSIIVPNNPDQIELAKMLQVPDKKNPAVMGKERADDKEDKQSFDYGNYISAYSDTIASPSGKRQHEGTDEQIEAAAKKLLATNGRNWVPIVVKPTGKNEAGDEQFEVVGNHFAYDVARKAGLERIWTVVADDTVNAAKPKTKQTKADSMHPSTAALISAIAKYQRLGYNVDSAINSLRQDARGEGVACGKSFISPRAKCSKEKSKTTSKEALQKTTAKAKARQQLRAEVEGRGKPKSKGMTKAEVSEMMANPEAEAARLAVMGYPKVEPSARSRRIAGLVDDLKTTAKAEDKNADRIQAVAAEALSRLGIETTPSKTQTQPTKLPAGGSGKQRLQAAMEGLKANTQADLVNAAQGLAVAQVAVNELTKQAEKDKQKEKRAISPTPEEGSTAAMYERRAREFEQRKEQQQRDQQKLATADLSKLTPEQRQVAAQIQRKVEQGFTIDPAITKQRREEIQTKLTRQGRLGRKELFENLAAWQAEDEVLRKLGFPTASDRPKPTLKPKGITSAPQSSRGRSGTAGDNPNYRGKYGYVSVDSLSPSTGSLISAIAKYKADGFDVTPAIEAFRKDAACGKGWQGTKPPGCTRAKSTKPSPEKTVAKKAPPKAVKTTELKKEKAPKKQAAKAKPEVADDSVKNGVVKAKAGDLNPVKLTADEMVNISDRLDSIDTSANGDRIGAAWAKIQGFDGKPELSSKADMDAAIARGETATYRGVALESHAKQLQTGELFVGGGLFGDSIYTAVDNPPGLGYKTASGYAGEGSTVVRMSIKPGLKIVKHDALIKEMEEAAEDFKEKKAPLIIQKETERLNKTVSLKKVDSKTDAMSIDGVDAGQVKKVGKFYRTILPGYRREEDTKFKTPEEAQESLKKRKMSELAELKVAKVYDNFFLNEGTYASARGYDGYSIANTKGGKTPLADYTMITNRTALRMQSELLSKQS